MKATIEKPYVPAGQKKNPNSLTYLFWLIRKQFVGESQEKFAHRLEAIDLPFPQKPVNKVTIKRIEGNKGDIHYFHMEKMAAITGIPAGLLLLFSRMYANRRDDFPKEHNYALAQKIIEIMKHIDDDTDFDLSELKVWKDIVS